MLISKVFYEGELHCRSEHLFSGDVVSTDAPRDNNGKGEAFSPTDLMSTSLAQCMITTMGIAAMKNKISFNNAVAEVDKEMDSDPRRVVRINVRLSIEDSGLSEKEKGKLEDAAINCPVAKSLHPDIIQEVSFQYVNSI